MFKHNISRTNIFLTEMIIVIVFFVIICTVILSVFTKSNNLCLDTASLNSAISVSQSNAEIFSSSFTYAKDKQNNSYTEFYDKDWNKTDNEDNSFYKIIYNVEYKYTDSGCIANVHQTVSYNNHRNNKTIFELDSSKFAHE